MSLEDYFIILGPHRNCANAWLCCCRMPFFGDLHPARTGRWLQWTSSPADANQRRFRRSRGYSSSQASDEKPHSSSSSLGFAATDVRRASLRVSCCMVFFCGSEKPPDSVLWHEHHQNAFVLSCCSSPLRDEWPHRNGIEHALGAYVFSSAPTCTSKRQTNMKTRRAHSRFHASLSIRQRRTTKAGFDFECNSVRLVHRFWTACAALSVLGMKHQQ